MMAVSSWRSRKDVMCETGALRRPFVQGCRNLGRRERVRERRVCGLEGDVDLDGDVDLNGDVDLGGGGIVDW